MISYLFPFFFLSIPNGANKGLGLEIEREEKMKLLESGISLE